MPYFGATRFNTSIIIIWWSVATLVERATGKGPDPSYLVESLTRRYQPGS